MNQIKTKTMKTTNQRRRQTRKKIKEIRAKYNNTVSKDDEISYIEAAKIYQSRKVPTLPKEERIKYPAGTKITVVKTEAAKDTHPKNIYNPFLKTKKERKRMRQYKRLATT